MIRGFTSRAFSIAAVMTCASAASAALLPPSGGLQFWVKSDAGVTTSSGSVTSWADQSGQGNNATGVSGALPTTSNQTVGDRVAHPVVAVTGGQSMRFSLPSANTFSGMTVLFVASAGASRDQYETVVSSGSTSVAERTSGVRWAFSLGSDVAGNGLGWAGPDSSIGLGSGSILTANTFYMNGYRTNKTAWDVTVSRDDHATAFYDDLSTNAPADTSFPTGTYKGVLGAESPGLATYALSGYIAEVLIYDHALNSTEMSSAVEYLNDRYFIPEPASAIVLGLGGWVLFRRRRS